MQIKTEAKSDNCSNSASFPAKPGKSYGTSLPSDGVLTLSVFAVAGGVDFSLSGDLALVKLETNGVIVRPTKSEGKGAITVHTTEGNVTVDVTVGGNNIVGLSCLSL